ncbi:hypothetical protein SASPL_117778 [Salvia splendens]|uniref:Uncharacterized protein n=1 Tax=Salvia splendens TaxID=180675 RepID=A0A8X8ZY39_SALSN|nr:hypothetical protein SASPL_117778 [Salvia splendens]
MTFVVIDAAWSKKLLDSMFHKAESWLANLSPLPQFEPRGNSYLLLGDVDVQRRRAQKANYRSYLISSAVPRRNRKHTLLQQLEIPAVTALNRFNRCLQYIAVDLDLS